MPQALYTFDLPEEQGELDSFMKGPNYRSAFCDIWNKLRNRLKYEVEPLPQDYKAALEEVKGWMREACDDWDVEVF